MVIKDMYTLKHTRKCCCVCLDKLTKHCVNSTNRWMLVMGISNVSLATGLDVGDRDSLLVLVTWPQIKLHCTKMMEVNRYTCNNIKMI